jgi:membrane-associated phospholipid phosphatase
MQAALASASAPATGSVSTVATFDDGWYRSITDFARHAAWLNGIMSLLTVALIAVLALMVGYAAWRAWRAADRTATAASAWAVAGSMVGVGLGLCLKQVFHETRPCLALSGVSTVQACPGPTDYSFPSDHTTVAAALAAGLWLINRRLGVIGGVIALVEGFSRVYLGQHYPHDVLAALVLSSVVVLGGWLVVRRPLIRLAGLVPSLGGDGGGGGGGVLPRGPRGLARATRPDGVAEATHGPQTSPSAATGGISTTTSTADAANTPPSASPSPSPSPSTESAGS